jgi:hypothetical protein
VSARAKGSPLPPPSSSKQSERQWRSMARVRAGESRYPGAAISLPGNRHEQARSESECYLALLLREGRKLLGTINNTLAGLRLAASATCRRVAQLLNPSLALFSRRRRSIPDRLPYQH